MELPVPVELIDTRAGLSALAAARGVVGVDVVPPAGPGTIA